MGKLKKADGYIRDLQTGNILPVQGKFVIQELEIQNKSLIKSRRKHLIQFEILTSAEVAKLDIEGNEPKKKK